MLFCILTFISARSMQDDQSILKTVTDKDVEGINSAIEQLAKLQKRLALEYDVERIEKLETVYNVKLSQFKNSISEFDWLNYSPTNRQETPLHTAAKWDHSDSIILFYYFAANQQVLNVSQQEPIDIAISYRSYQAACALICSVRNSEWALGVYKRHGKDFVAKPHLFNSNRLYTGHAIEDVLEMASCDENSFFASPLFQKYADDFEFLTTEI